MRCRQEGNNVGRRFDASYCPRTSPRFLVSRDNLQVLRRRKLSLSLRPSSSSSFDTAGLTTHIHPRHPSGTAICFRVYGPTPCEPRFLPLLSFSARPPHHSSVTPSVIVPADGSQNRKTRRTEEAHRPSLPRRQTSYRFRAENAICSPNQAL